jgi:NAD(P)H-hydrate epimerase
MMIDPLLSGLYTAAQMRAMDKAAIDGLGIPGGYLMERAGIGVTAEIFARFDPESAVVYCGKGNNGGDGFVVARELANEGVDVAVFAVAGRDGYKDDALLNLEVLERLGVEVRDGLPAVDDPALFPDLVVDAVFGTGFSGVAEGPAAAAIKLINCTPAPVVSVDIASGVDGSTGEVGGSAVLADLTVTMHEAKVGHFVTPGGELAGEVVVVPIGIPPDCRVEPDVWVLDAEGLAPLLRLKGMLDHKRSVGTLLVIGGTRGMAGAAFMAAMGALRSGAGLVHCAVPRAAAGEKPFVEIITAAVPDEDYLTVASLEALRAEMGGLKAAVLGPGMGRAPETVELVHALIVEDVPLLIDADALWALGGRPELLAGRGAPTVLTPHEGELGRLLGKPAAEVAEHRLACAREAAARSGATLLLKGEASIVAEPSGKVYVVPTGNPGLATPGTGDVLSGAIGAQLAKGLPGTDAACLGGYLHGLAADLAADLSVGTDCMVAGDLFEFLPAAMERIKQGIEPEQPEED